MRSWCHEYLLRYVETFQWRNRETTCTRLGSKSSRPSTSFLITNNASVSSLESHGSHRHSIWQDRLWRLEWGIQASYTRTAIQARQTMLRNQSIISYKDFIHTQWREESSVARLELLTFDPRSTSKLSSTESRCASQSTYQGSLSKSGWNIDSTCRDIGSVSWKDQCYGYKSSSIVEGWSGQLWTIEHPNRGLS